MTNKLKLKIIITFIIIEIIVITLFGLFTLYEIKSVTNVSPEIASMLDEKAKTMSFAILGAIGACAVATFILGTIAINVMTAPISKILKSAEKIAAGESIDVRYISNKKEEEEVGDIIKAFNLMTTELQENLNEASRQKRQIERIAIDLPL